ncbi:type II toxin-antitoxin system VapC family toxin [Tsukamurella spumae]|uniref:Type II toxin-antitoxin system VapC family toxin n=1 Tax=Tsukamurella spumae TaxID=44753 RepID=A0A846X2J1_9ACTN|nr:type II toxin-antitoxin system VapC family toxin [Tsukamurella spumae]NKY19373.1 type II toxin-antitoxin system VapC family toxin [Tsukamurella spumae]
MLVPIPFGRPQAPGAPAPESPEIQQVRAVIASILGSLRSGPYLPESGLNWAVAYLTRGAEPLLVATTTDAGWLPRGTVVPADVRVLWNVPTAAAWATVDDPVRQLIEFAEGGDYTIRAVATTHPSRAYHIPNGPWKLVGQRHPGPVLPRRATRFEVVASPARVERIRSMGPEEAARQTRALLRDLEGVTVDPAHAIGLDEARAEARRYLFGGHPVPQEVLAQLLLDQDALADALSLTRTSPRVLTAGGEPPDGAALRDRLLERALVEATLSAAYHDVESAVYAWTFARYLAR